MNSKSGNDSEPHFKAARREQGRYFSVSHIDAALQEATHPPGAPSAEYPLMLYLRGERDHYITVPNAEAEAKAATEGYQRSINPPGPNYPRWMTENPQKKVWDYRGVWLHSTEEEARWRAAVNTEDWIDDTVQLWGARGTSLEYLEEQRKEMVKAMIDDDLLELVEKPADVELVERHHARVHEQRDEVLQSPAMSDADGESAT
jgi:hypothetical protein